MKSLIYLALIFITILVCTKLNGQTYHQIPDSNVIWNEFDVYIYDSTNVDYRWRLGIIGDTVFNTKTYSKLYNIINDTVLNINHAVYYAAIREESKIVYAVTDDTQLNGIDEAIVYDFNLAVGDTFYSNNPYHYYSGNEVIAIDSVLLNDNLYHKRYWFNPMIASEYWIEGVGSNQGILFPITPFTLNYYEPHLACMKHNDTAIYLENYSCNRCFCQLYTGVCDEQDINFIEINLFPNPLTSISKLTIEKTLNVPISVIIRDIKGKIVGKINETMQYEIEVNGENLISGIYIVEIYANNRLIGLKKAIVK